MERFYGITIDRNTKDCMFGRLQILGAAFRTRRKGSRTDWQVVAACSCGSVACYYLQNLLTGKTSSCGCLQKERTSKASKTHGQRRNPIYAIWNSMRSRCTNPKNPAYDNYGGRGIKVCQSWLKFENFFQDMGNRPSPQHSIDRIDVNGDYCPENCRWATAKEQANNKRNNLTLTINGVTKHYSVWAKEYGLATKTVLKRIKKGCEGEACLRPSRNKFKNLKITKDNNNEQTDEIHRT